MTRAQRLGLEPGSIEPDDIDQTGPRATEREIAHSIAISLKQIADAMVRAEEFATTQVRGPSRSDRP